MRYGMQTPFFVPKRFGKLKRWSNLIAFVIIACGTLLVGLAMLSHARNVVLSGEIWRSGMEFAGYIDNEYSNLSHILSGNANSEDVEAELGRIAELGNVFHFEFRDVTGEVRFETGSYHSGEGAAEHHAHRHDDAASPDSADSVPGFLARSGGPATEHAPVQGANGEAKAHSHDVIFHDGDGVDAPFHYAEIIRPVTDHNGAFTGQIVLLMDVTERTDQIDQVLFMRSAGLVGLFAILAAGPLFYYISSIRREQEADATIRYLAKHDPLTGALNRLSFIEALNERLKGAGESAGVAVYVIDLDDFKKINDTHGYDVGDVVLKTVVGRISGVAGEHSLCARLAGDELAVLQWGVESLEEVDTTADAIVEVACAPINEAGHTMSLFASVGTAVALQHGVNPEDLMRSADLAVYQAKRLGRGRAVRLTPSLEAELAAQEPHEASLSLTGDGGTVKPAAG